MCSCHALLADWDWGPAAQQTREVGCVGRQVATELVEPVLEPSGGSRDAEGGDHVAARTLDGYGDAGEADLELVVGDRPAALAGGDAVAAQRLAGSATVDSVSCSRSPCGTGSAPHA